MCGTKNSCVPVEAYLLFVITAIKAVNSAPVGHGRNIACAEMGFPHLPQPPVPSLKLWLHLFSCRKLSFGLGWICYCNPSAATNREGSHSVRLLKKYIFHLNVVWVTPPLDAYSLSTRITNSGFSSLVLGWCCPTAGVPDKSKRFLNKFKFRCCLSMAALATATLLLLLIAKARTLCVF